VTSSVVGFEAATWVKSMYISKSWFKNRKKRTYGNQRHLCINLHLKDRLQMLFTAC